MTAPFNTILLSKIRELLGETGPKKNRAVRWSEIEEIYANARVAGAEAGGAAINGGAGGSQVRVGAETAEQLLERVEAIRSEAEEAAKRASKAVSLTDQLLVQHGAAVEGFMSSIGRELEEHRLQAVSKTELQLSLDSVSSSAQGFQRVLDAVGDVTAGAAVAVATGAAAIGQTGTILVTEGATPRVASGVTNGASFQIPLNQSLVYAGQRIRIAVLARRPVTGAATAFGIAYSAGADGNSGVLVSGNTSAAWAWHTFFFNCPAAVVGGPSHLGLFGDNAKSGGTTDFARVVIELAAVAGELPEIETLNGQITELRGLDLDGLDGTAFGVLLSQLQVNAGGSSATISQQGTAIATLQGNATASYVFRAQAGSSNALLELVAASNPNGAVSTARIAADNILLKGSVAMEYLVVTDLGGNLIPNGTFAYGDLRGWDQIASTYSIYDQATDTTNPGLTSPTQYGLKIAADAMNGYNARCLAYLPARPGDRFSTSFMYAVAGATRDATLSLFINWYDKTGAVIDWTYLTESNASSNAWATKSGTAQAPTGTAFGRVAVRRSAGGAGTAYMTNIEVIRQRSGKTLITPSGITTDLLSTTDFAAAGLAIFGGTVQSENFNAGAGTGWQITQAGALTIPNASVTNAKIANLAVGNAKIANLAVDTIKIGDDAVTKFDYTYSAANLQSNSDPFIMQSTVINKSRTQPLVIHASLTVVSASYETPFGVVQIRDGTNAILLGEFPVVFSDKVGSKVDFYAIDTNTTTGNITYQLRVRSLSGVEVTCSKRFIGALNTFK